MNELIDFQSRTFQADMIPIRKLIWHIQRFLVHRVLHADETPHRLALGIALAIFIAWTPTIGMQMILVLLCAPLLRANGRVGLPLVWISNPLTIPIIYYPNYVIGRYLVGLFRQGQSPNYQTIQQMFQNIHSSAVKFYELTFWKEVFSFLVNIGLELWVGSVIMGLFLAIITYITSYKSIVWYRQHTPLGRRFAAKLHRKLKHKAHERKQNQ